MIKWLLRVRTYLSVIVTFMWRITVPLQSERSAVAANKQLRFACQNGAGITNQAN